MNLLELGLELQPLPGPVRTWRAAVGVPAWLRVARTVAESGGRLISMWGVERSAGGSGAAACAAFALPEGLLWLELALKDGNPRFPDLAPLFPAAARMQRAMADLCGQHALGSADDRAWLDHGLWAPGQPPLRAQAAPQREGTEPLPADYAFVRVEGDGVHEIAVGPVHAGIIEPGHFRFSVVGEKVLRLEQRLGYVHKGIERRFTELPPLQGHRLAGRVSGDSTVAYAWAYCMALESAWDLAVPERANWLRALMLERERVANHLGDLGALGNDAALAFGLAQFSRLREDWQRLSHEVFGHRLLMDRVLPGGVDADPSLAQRDAMRRHCDRVETELQRLRLAYDEHAGLQDRFVGTGRVTPALAAQLGLAGMAGRASGQAFDMRCDHPWAPYAELRVHKAGSDDGDVAARVAVRFDEVLESLRLIRLLCTALPVGQARQAPAAPAAPGATAVGVGWVEGWRGEIFVALQTDADGRIERCHCHDPSWQNWPVLEHAVIGNIVPDFPLINKSFNLSYSGHDL